MTYEVLIDKTSREEWDRQAREFADYSIYQTWAYQQVRAEMSGQQLSRVLVRDEGGCVAAMGHVRIKTVKALGLKIGYVQWGPLLRKNEGKVNCDVEVLERLRDAYLGSRVNVLRVAPNVNEDEGGADIVKMIEACGFSLVPAIVPYRTIVVSLDGTDENVRNRMEGNWRRNLRKAEAAKIEIRQGTSGEYYDVLEKLYRAAVQRKGFKGLDPDEFIRTQQMLSDCEKTNVVLAYIEGQPVAAHATSHLGDTAVGTLAASSEEGLKLGASYLVWWRTLLAAKSAGMKAYDLGGIDPENNPTVYFFKKRMGGVERSHIGVFETCTSPAIRTIWRVCEKLYSMVRK